MPGCKSVPRQRARLKPMTPELGECCERLSDYERIAAMLPSERDALLRALGEEGCAWLERDWRCRARPEQLPPDGDWRLWLVMAGRGFGKTRMGAEWVRAIAERDGSAVIALVGASLHDARAVMVEGESGLLALAQSGRRPVWQPSLRQLKWPGGARAIIYGAVEPETLRGPQHSHAWADEIGRWPNGIATWDNLMMGLRLGAKPRVMVTTTPRAVPLVKRLVAQEGAVITRGRTIDNAGALPPDFLDAMTGDYGGTRIGRQELDGELLLDHDGALWTRTMIEAARTNKAPYPLVRVVIGVDPSASSRGDACGIVAVGLDREANAFVLEDATAERARPEQWARTVEGVAARWAADRIIAEANNGGEMVRSVLKAAGGHLPVRLVHASRGKTARAEPVAALYERGRVRHAGAFPALEDQLCGLLQAGGYEGPGRSPDRADALVWAVTELLLSGRATARLRSL